MKKSKIEKLSLLKQFKRLLSKKQKIPFDDFICNNVLNNALAPISKISNIRGALLLYINLLKSFKNYSQINWNDRPVFEQDINSFLLSKRTTAVADYYYSLIVEYQNNLKREYVDRRCKDRLKSIYTLNTPITFKRPEINADNFNYIVENILKINLNTQLIETGTGSIRVQFNNI